MDLLPGRVQSAALRLVCEREAAIEAFKPRDYWSVEVTLRTAAGVTFQVRGNADRLRVVAWAGSFCETCTPDSRARVS